ncbi:hypothetical protein H2200_007283 [Cladophialophora chaetospira]|uniref:FAD/NAD(P)-binding domain-containing protein n=1 Tax=Cladophialophora chaetospira TaxID=386627 RepID=A0AA38X7H9_9EURO|nr:hypothetical protein H2200_007283 [Cladophialophora chaetospira]
MEETIAADYLVVGAGAMGMAFVDTLITDSTKTVVVVDRYARPGGHWTTAYPFVHLHQPAEWYGVNSKRLETEGIEEFGWNKGLVGGSSRDEVCAYFEEVMKKTFLASGRVRYFPKSDYVGEGEFRSIITGKTYRVGKDTCIVDATYSQTVVPSMRPPPYEVAREVEIVTPNDLPGISRGYANYTVVGAGKTGMDACLWLLENGIDASHITWIRPRESLLLERDAFQPGPEFATKSYAFVKGIMESIMVASSLEDVLKHLVAAQVLLQVDESVAPTMFHCGTVSRLEFEALKQIKSVIRKGRVTRVTPEEVILNNGSYKPVPDTLYIDCSASAIPQVAPVPVFQDHKIILQPVRYCQQTFSAAMIAHVEATYDDEQLKNELCGPVPMPHEPIDFPVVMLQTNLNALGWHRQPKTVAWLSQCRLDYTRYLGMSVPEDAEQKVTYQVQRIMGLEASCKKIQGLINKLPEKDAAKMNAQLRASL